MTALQLNGNQDNSTTTGLTTTANQVVNDTTGTTTSAKTTLIGMSTGWGEVWSRNQVGAWAAAGAIGAPDGHGFCLDSTVLEGQQIIAGNWTPVLRGAVSVGTLTVDMNVRAYKRSSGGVYTSIGTMTLATQAMTTTITTYTFTATSLALTNFATGDRLYMDVWFNVTVNGTASGTATINMQTCNNAGKGRSGNMQLATPGYQATPGLNTVYLITNRKQVGRIQ